MESGKNLNLIRIELAAVLFALVGLFLLLCLLTFISGGPIFLQIEDVGSIRNFGGLVGSHVSGWLIYVFGLTSYLFPISCFVYVWRAFHRKILRLSYQEIIVLVVCLVVNAGFVDLLVEDFTIRGQLILPAGGLVGQSVADLLIVALNRSGATFLLASCLLLCVMSLTRFSVSTLVKIVVSSCRHVLRLLLGCLRVQWRYVQNCRSLHTQRISISNKYLPSPPSKKKKSPKVRERNKQVPQYQGQYRFPTVDMLAVKQEASIVLNRKWLEEQKDTLETTLKHFSVFGQVTDFRSGPLVTMYEFAPDSGIKVNTITRLADDLAMALHAVAVRIIAPVPGRGVVGIEVPNPERKTVFFRNVAKSDDFQQAGKRLPLALGADTMGFPVAVDLATMPHLLVAGSTGSGKSVSINTMILSLLFHTSPQDLKLIMIDPKILELQIYEGIPHLLLPVVSQPKKAVLALNWAVQEMERRYRLLADKGVRSIDNYNKKLAEDQVVNESSPDAEMSNVNEADDLAEKDDHRHTHLPYIVIIIDELADLMMAIGRDIEEPICRLAQKARAAGIHLILATQRPSVDVITGKIKANLPARISFQVTTATDSRTILDQGGAETLLGQGDMLFLSAESGMIQRIHGAYVSDQDIQRVVDHIKTQGAPEYNEFLLQAAEPEREAGGEAEDEKWEEAVSLVIRTQHASISLLQRRLRIGFNRAARMIERMEAEGFVGPADGTGKPRSVLRQKDS